MRKYLVFVTILCVLALSACGKEDKQAEKPVEDTTNNVEETNGTDGSEEGLKLQVLKGDEEAGVTLEDGLYGELNKIVQENPTIGIADDFSLYVVNTIHDDQGNSRLVLLGINRLPVAIKNFTFDYTLGNKDNEYVWEKQGVKMNEAEAGILEPNSALPIVLDITEEQLELLKSLTEENQVMAIENFKFEEVK